MTIYVTSRLVRLALPFAAAFSLALSGCSLEVAEQGEEAVESVEQGVINGTASNTSVHPYESLFVRVRMGNSYCTGTVLGNAVVGRSSWVLTARHCTRGEELSTIRAETTAGTIYAKNVYENPDGLDVALIELKSSVPTTYNMYFTSQTPAELVGDSVRCFGFGAYAWTDSNGDGSYTSNEFTGGGTRRYADFVVKAASLQPDVTYELTVPNSRNQALAPGDSGGPCIKSSNINSTSAINITGVHKAGTVSNNTGRVTYNRQTAASAFSDWVRQYVPRP